MQIFIGANNFISHIKHMAYIAMILLSVNGQIWKNPDVSMTVRMKSYD